MREGYFWDVGLGVFICKACEYAGDTEDEMQHHACPGTPWFKRDALEYIKTMRFQGEPPDTIKSMGGCTCHASPEAHAAGQEEPSAREQVEIFWRDWHRTFDVPPHNPVGAIWAYAQQQVRGLQITSDGWKETAGYLSERANTAERALHDLTPGGSEFVNDVPRCVAWIRQRFANDHEITKKAIIAKKALEQALRELRDDILRTEGVGRVGSLEVAVKRINKLLAETV